VGKRNKEPPPPNGRFGDGPVAKNRRARFDYELGQRFEAGLVLIGSEVKMLRMGHADLSDAYVTVDGGEAFVRGMNVPELTHAAFGHTAKRPRKLLLHAREIQQLARGIERDGMTAVAVRLYFRDGRAKLEIALAKGKKTVDKRRAIKAREADREAEAAMERYRQR
jgi:SsrA-binding protein